MLIEFSVGNYRSFKAIQTFSMVAANITAKDKEIDEHSVFNVDNDLKLLKSAAIYGANASGKSNLIAAINFMSQFVLGSSKETQIAEEIKIETFRLSEESDNQPAYFQVAFMMGGQQYRYGFEVTTQRVISEWLYYVPFKREARLFERERDDITVSAAFKEGRKFKKNTRNNALFLSVAAQFNEPIAQNILLWFKDVGIISGLQDLLYRSYTVERFVDNEYKKNILEFVKNLDVGVDDIRIEKTKITYDSLPKNMPEELKDLYLRSSKGEKIDVKTIHRKYNIKNQAISDETFDIDNHESEGTKKLFVLAGPLMHTLANGHIIFVDELDARLHPLITCAIIKLFNSNVTNPHNAQLVFTTHDTNLLSHKMFRRDQIWFTEKDKYGASYLYSLVEYKIGDGGKVRNDASFETDYIRGKYGAIPFIGDFNNLLRIVDA